MGTHLYLVRISLIFATQVSPFFSCKSFSVDSGQKPTVLELNLLSQSRPPLPTVSFLLLLSIQVCLCTELKLPLAMVSDVVNHCLKTVGSAVLIAVQFPRQSELLANSTTYSQQQGALKEGRVQAEKQRCGFYPRT